MPSKSSLKTVAVIGFGIAGGLILFNLWQNRATASQAGA